MRILGKILTFLILGLRPLFGPQNTTCRYLFTCTQYAEEELKNKTFLLAIWSIVKRVISCNPFYNNFD